MAPRKHKGRARSKVKAVEEDVTWNAAESVEDEGSPTERSGTSPKRNLPQRKPVSPGSKANDGMMTLMRQFLEAQERREERHMLELRGLRETIMQSALPAQSSMDMGSLRMDLPTPAAPRVTGHYDADHDVGFPRFPAPNQPLQRAEPKIPVFQQGEDIESYLRRFERLAKTWRWPQEEWSCRLVPLLTGQALEAYLAMDEDQAEQYSELREALLAKFDVSAETYRQRFRAATVPAGESPTESYNRLKNLFNRWVRPEDHTKEEIGEIVILEQLLRVLPYDARTWVK
nr:uncharacterized protein LOC129414922 [Misgurnus anguillicaudatus]